MNLMTKYQVKANIDLIDAGFNLYSLMLNFKKRVLLHFNKLPIVKIYSYSSIDCFYYIIKNYSKFPDKLKDWVKNNIFNNINSSFLIIEYMIKLNDSLINNKENELDLIINSFKDTKLIKDIKLNNENKTFTLVSNDNDILYFKPCYNENHEEYKQKCHKITYDLLKKSITDSEEVYGVSILIPTFYDIKEYHSFIVKNNKIIDPSHNLIADFNNYIKIIKPEILYYEDAKTILNNIDELYKDDSFDKDMYEIVNYAISKQIKK